MNIVVCGNDERYQHLKVILKNNGFQDHSPADLLVLAPKQNPLEFLDKLAPGGKIFGGLPTARQALVEMGYTPVIPSTRYTVQNSEDTAQVALGLSICNIKSNLSNAHPLILGFGYLGVALAKTFAPFCKHITICARNPRDLEQAKKMGLQTMPLSELCLHKFDLILNTIPVKILSEEILNTANNHPVLLEMASSPCCDSTQQVSIIKAAALPGVYSPISAAQNIYQEILSQCERV